MVTINSIVTTLFSTALDPLANLGAAWGVVAVSLVAGVILALAYGKLSNQGALKRVKRGITAGMYESVIFRHDLKLSLAAQWRMLLGGVRYVALAIPPILVLLIPSILVLAQLNLRYGYRPLTAGERAVVTLKVLDQDQLFVSDLKGSDGLQVSPPVRDLDQGSVSWRVDTGQLLATTKPIALKLTVDGDSAEQTLHVGGSPSVIPTQLSSSILDQLLYPGASIPESLTKKVKSISIEYPKADLLLGGLKTDWLVLFALVSIAAGLVASRLLKIEI